MPDTLDALAATIDPMNTALAVTMRFCEVWGKLWIGLLAVAAVAWFVDYMAGGIKRQSR